MNTTFFVDIDQTISTGHVGRDLAESVQYYRNLGVWVPDDIGSWLALFQLPDVVRRHEVLPNALPGTWHLHEHGTLFYATARKPDVEQMTRDWLSQEGFPRPEHVIFCQGVSEKLLALAEYSGSLVLVDDRWCQIVDILARYGETHRVLRSVCQRLVLVAYGASQAEVPESSVVPIVPLPNWTNVHAVLMAGHENGKKG